MKRAMTVLLVLAVAALSYAAGVATKPGYKFPWLPKGDADALAAPCNKTLLEWKCLEAKVKTQPLGMGMGMAIADFEAAPTPQRLEIKANFVMPSHSAKEAWEMVTQEHVKRALTNVDHHANQFVCRVAYKNGRRIELYLYGKSIAVFDGTNIKFAEGVNPDPLLR